jgi:hypothetical protein
MRMSDGKYLTSRVAALGRWGLIGVLLTVGIGCNEEELRTLESENAELRQELENVGAELTSIRDQLKSAQLEKLALEEKLVMESPGAYYGMLSDLRGNRSAWEQEARKFLEIHPETEYSPKVRRELERVERERREAEMAAVLRTVHMATVFARVGEYQGKKLDRELSCDSPRVSDAMYGRLALMADQAGLKNSDEYSHSLLCEVVGESWHHLRLFVTGSQLKELPVPSVNKYGGRHVVFEARLRTLGAYGSNVAMAVHRIL